MTLMNFKKLIPAIILFGVMAALLYSCKKETEEPNTSPQPFFFKENLSDYGFYSGELKNLNPASDVFTYELSTPLFSDHTIKDRFIRLPEGKSITYTDKGVLQFPLGSIIIKNFSHPKPEGGLQRIETRLLVLDPYDSKWKVMVYLWNETQTEAVKHITGKTLSINLKDEEGKWLTTNYKVPNTNDCKGCHISFSTITPIGPKARNLNFTPSFTSKNQLSDMAEKGHLSGLPASGVPVLPVWDDPLNFTLDQRARAYLEANCAHCHEDGGAAAYTGFWVDFEQTNTSKLGYYKVPIAAGPGSGVLTYDIVPGNADSSIVIFRMNSSQAGIAMPELARSVIHEKGVQLIREWIESL
jgi:uncharacterized repeat protein (TIGR03806 family)